MALSNVLITLSLFIILAKMAHSQDTTSFTFQSFSPKPADLTYEVDAHAPSEFKLLRLTATSPLGIPQNSSIGRVLYSKPVQLWEESTGKEANFETTIKFVITPSQNGAADGLIFFIVPVNASLPQHSDAGNLGIFDSLGINAPLFAVEFDNWSNLWDPSYRHIGIDINSRISYNVTKFDSATGEEVTARISYNATTKTITVVASRSYSLKPAQLSYVIEFKGLRTVLPESVQVGISASTGEINDNLGIHDIHSWSFTSKLVNTSSNDSNNNEENGTYIRKFLAPV